MPESTDRTDVLIKLAAETLTGQQRRLFQAQVTRALCDGSPRRAERRFGFGRETVRTGLGELDSGIRCVEDFPARGRVPMERADPRLAADIRDIVEPHTHADPELKADRRYCTLAAREVLELLRAGRGYAREGLPSERTMRDILNRMGYRLKRIRKAEPLKKTGDTDAIFANVRAVREQSKGDPEILEISVDTKAKVSEGDYARGGKNPDDPGRGRGEGLGS
jgi:hypothetical protein